MQRVHNTLKIAIKLRDNLICLWCQRTCDLIDRRYEPTLDHLVPIKYNGPSTWENLVVACRDCNQCRRSKSIEEFAASRQLSISDIRSEIRRRTKRSKRKFMRDARLYLSYHKGRTDAIDEAIRSRYNQDGGQYEF